MSSTEIRKRKYYVTMTDRFMSGWGKAEGKTNKFVIGTDDYDRAEKMAALARMRSDMRYVNIAIRKPYYNRNRVLVSYEDAEKISWK